MYSNIITKTKKAKKVLYKGKNLLLSSNIQDMFASTDGFWYDYQDLSTMYQDTAGSIPVTTPGQPVALVLDKSKNLALSAETFVNGDFSNSTTGWSVNLASTTVTVETDPTYGTYANVTTKASTGGIAKNAFTVGKCYEISYAVKVLSGSFYLGINSNPINTHTATTNSTWTTVTRKVYCATNATLRLYSTVDTESNFLITKISVKQILGNHAFQATSSLRPLLSRYPITGVRNLLTYSNDFSNAIWAVTGGSKVTGLLDSYGMYNAVEIKGPTTQPLRRLITVSAGGPYTLTIRAKAGSSGNTTAGFLLRNDTTGINFSTLGNFNLSTGTCPTGWTSKKSTNSFWDFTFVQSSGISSGDSLAVYFGTYGNVDSTFSIIIDTIQLEYGTVSTTLQNTKATVDVVEPNVRSYYSLSYDGIDDYLTTTVDTALLRGTLFRGYPNKGAKIIYSTNIPLTYNDNTNSSELLYINRAVTFAERAKLITVFDNKNYTNSIECPTSKLFNAEVGFYTDLDDLTTLYQDAAGITPVTAAGQPVGLLIDKSKNLAFGPELFNDSAAVLTYEATRISVGSYNIASTGNVSSVTFPLGGAYKYVEVDFEITRVGSGSIYITPATGASIAISTLGRRRMRFMCYRNGNDISFVRSSTPTDVDFTVYSIREIYGNHAYQTTTASRPILRQTPILGPELSTGGDFNDASAWTLGTGFTISDGVLSSTTDISKSAKQTTLNIVSGRTYKVSYLATGVTVDAIRINILSPTDNFQTAYINKNGFVEVIFTATITGTFALFCYKAGVTIDNVSVKEVQGYSPDKNYLEFDGVDDFLTTNAIDFTTTNKLSLFVGVKKLNDTANASIIESSTDPNTSDGAFALTALSSGVFQSSSRGTVSALRQSNAYTAPYSAVLSVSTDIASPLNKLKVNSNALTSTATQGTGNYGKYPLYICRRAGTSLPFAGNIYSIILVNRLTADNETLILEKAIARQTGVSL